VKKSKYREEQIVRILKEVEAGAKVGETCRKHRLSEPTDPLRDPVLVSVTVLTTFSAAPSGSKAAISKMTRTSAPAHRRGCDGRCLASYSDGTWQR
jgi:hypothetical protein